MTSVQNHLLPLSGSKYWLILCAGLFLAGCSPKVRPGTTKKPESTQKDKIVDKPSEKLTEANIALLMPFRLNEINLKTATKADVERSAMAIDFYQGFKLGIDSAAAKGMNFKVRVYDTRDSNDQLASLVENGSLASSQLIVGPVFPESIKYLGNYTKAKHIPMVSPLAATHPNEFSNPNLISLVNNIDLHAAKIGSYVTGNYNPANTVVVLISTKSSSDEMLAAPLRRYFSNSKRQFVLQEYASVYSMETKMRKDKQYVVMVVSSDRKFVVPTLDRLVKIKNKGFKLQLFGHPDWIKQNYNTDKLQTLATSVTSSYKVDYKSAAVVGFIRRYRAKYRFEPGEYAFKGFDAGLYFGQLLAKHGRDYLNFLTRDEYKGLHNNFSFEKDDQLGYINTSLMLLQYKDFALNVIE